MSKVKAKETVNEQFILRAPDLVTAVKADWDADQAVCIWGNPGIGKCLGRGTPVLMFDGTIKPVEDIRVGEQVMGHDSLPRTVIALNKGQEALYRVIPTKGESWVCNESHVLSLKHSGTGRVLNIEVRDYLNQSKSSQIRHKQYRAGVSFAAQTVNIDPYVLGVWLGDGDSDGPQFTLNNKDQELVTACAAFATTSGVEWRKNEQRANYAQYSMAQDRTGMPKSQPNPITAQLRQYNLLNNKHIPQEFKVNSSEVRLQVLAGLMDADGHFTTSSCFDYITKHEQLANDVTFVARSLGFAAYVTPARKSCIVRGEKREGAYFRVTISGHVDKIPTRVARKQASARRQVKDVLVTGITLESLGVGDYFGFELSGPDKLFLLGDFTVTHNSDIMKQLADDLTTESKHPYQLIDFRASQYDPTDIKGFPDIDRQNDCMRWVAPHWFPKAGTHGIFFADEANRATRLVLNALLQLFRDRRIADWHLPEGWKLAMCCNPDTSSGTIDMGDALNTRVSHYFYEADLESWYTWARKHQIHPLVIAFLKFRMPLFHVYDRHAKAYPNPRAWEYVSKVLDRHDKQRIKKEILAAMIAAKVGHGAAAEFIAFVDLQSKAPDLQAILRDPKGADVSKDPAVLYAVAAGLGALATPENFKAVLQYLGRLDPEYNVFAVNDAIGRNPDLTRTTDYSAWGMKHKAAIA